MSTVELLCADQIVRVDASICEMATERVHWGRFLAPGHALHAALVVSPDLVVRSASLKSATELDRALVVPHSSLGALERDTPHSPLAGATESDALPDHPSLERGDLRHAPIAKTPALIVRRHTSLEGATEIDAPLGRCRFRFDGQTLDVVVEDGMYRGELVLRLAWYLLGTKLGAVLIHACAVKQGDVALVASGKSGDGKSTLARLCVGAGLEVLTDEVVMLFPDGRVSGTPFRSDFDNAGRPGLVQARYFVALEKAPHEALEPLAPLAAVQLAMSQCFDVAEVALPRVEVRRRLLAFLGAVEVRTLAFRKDAAAGEFVRRALQE